jgi:BMFP domain-containing protein YqiC
MSAVLEQYFQSVVVDKVSEMISRQFQEIKNDIETQFSEIRSDIMGLKKLDSNYADIRIDIEGLKNRISELGQDISGKMRNSIERCETNVIGTIREDIKELLTKNGKKPDVAKKLETVKKAVTKKTTTRKKAAKK